MTKAYCFTTVDKNENEIRIARDIVTTEWLAQHPKFEAVAIACAKVFRSDFPPSNGCFLAKNVLLSATHMSFVTSQSDLGVVAVCTAMQFNDTGFQTAGTFTSLQPETMFAHGDVAFVSSNPQNNHEFANAKISKRELVIGDSVRLFGICPSAPSCLVTASGVVEKISNSEIWHSIPTHAGDSGAVIVADDGEVVAVHSSGTEATSTNPSQQIGTRVDAKNFDDYVVNVPNAVTTANINDAVSELKIVLSKLDSKINLASNSSEYLREWIQFKSLGKTKTTDLLKVFDQTLGFASESKGTSVFRKSGGELNLGASGGMSKFLQLMPGTTKTGGDINPEASGNLDIFLPKRPIPTSPTLPSHTNNTTSSFDRFKTSVCWVFPLSKSNTDATTNSNGNRPLASGIGFFIGDQYILTAKHTVIHGVVLRNMRAFQLHQKRQFKFDNDFYLGSRTDGLNANFSYQYQGQDFVILRVTEANVNDGYALCSHEEISQGQNVGAITITDIKGQSPAIGGYNLKNPRSTDNTIIATSPKFPYIYHLASTFSGDSGCPLVSTAGQVIGINTGSVEDTFNRGSSIKTIALEARKTWLEKAAHNRKIHGQTFEEAVPGLALAL
jgi:V8-like Glu-specific endopeptidase